jgi:hypothetical protein
MYTYISQWEDKAVEKHKPKLDINGSFFLYKNVYLKANNGFVLKFV